MATPERRSLMQNAVSFLLDPNVSRLTFQMFCTNCSSAGQSQSSTFAQRIQFLEAKGLTPSEIEEVMLDFEGHMDLLTYVECVSLLLLTSNAARSTGVPYLQQV